MNAPGNDYGYQFEKMVSLSNFNLAKISWDQSEWQVTLLDVIKFLKTYSNLT